MSSARRNLTGTPVAMLLSVMLAASQARAQQPAPAGTLTENQVVDTAIRRSPSLHSAVLEYRRASWAVTGEEVRYVPVLQIDGTVSRTASPRLTSTGTSVSESYGVDAGAQVSKHYYTGTDLSLRVGGSWEHTDSGQTFTQGGNGSIGPAWGASARFSVNQPFLRGAGRDVGEAELRTARIRRTTAEYTRDRAASDLLKSVVTAYWELWYANESLSIERQSRALAVEQRDEAVARMNTGTLSAADVLTFETQVATRDEDVLNAEVELKRRQLDLAKALGTGSDPSVAGVPSEMNPPMPGSPPSNAEALALQESPQIRELESALSLARLQATTADDAKQARLDLTAWVQTEGLGNNDVAAALGQAGRMGAVSAQVGLTYEEPLDSTGRQADRTRALLAIQVAEQDLLDAKQGASSDIRVALARDEAGRRKVALAEQTAGIAKKQLDAERARFATGASTPIAVLQAEDQVRSADLRVARARADLFENALTIQHLTGQLVARYAMLSKAVSDADSGPTASSVRGNVGLF